MKKDRIIELSPEALVRGNTYHEIFRLIKRGTNELINPESFDSIIMDIRTGPDETSSKLITASMFKVSEIWTKENMDVVDGELVVKFPGHITKDWQVGEYYREITFIKGNMNQPPPAQYNEVVSKGYGVVNVYNNITEIPGYSE